MDDKIIRVWRFEDAPIHYQALAADCSDVDWLAHIPATLADQWIGWAEEETPFGICRVEVHQLSDGSIVRIGAHA